MIELMSPFEIMEEITTLIEKERISQKIKQKDLANRAGISTATYSKFLKNKNITLENMLKLMFTLNMSANLEGLLSKREFSSLDEIRELKENKQRKRVR